MIFRCVGQDGDDDDDWAEETTEEAQRRRMDEISDHAKNLTLSEDLEKPLEQRVNLFYSFVKVSLTRLSVADLSDSPVRWPINKVLFFPTVERK